MSGHPVPHICSVSRLFSCQRLVGVMVPEVCGVLVARDKGRLGSMTGGVR